MGVSAKCCVDVVVVEDKHDIRTTIVMVDAFVANEKVWKNQPWPKNKRVAFLQIFSLCENTCAQSTVLQLFSSVYILYTTMLMGK